MSAAAPAPPQAGAALEVRDLGKRFQVGERAIDALRGVGFEARGGVVTGLIGPDGAGKTTLMRIAAGLLAPDAGSVQVLGRDVTREALAVQALLGYMPQRFGLYEDLSVQENLDLYADLQGVPRAARAARYAELMRMTGLAAFTRRLAGRLSGGMKQKLGLACALVRAPRLLLLDEPTVGVDPVSRRELWQIVYRLVQDEGMSVLVSTAYLDEAERCDAVVLLHEGRVLDQGAPADFQGRVAGRTFAVSAPEASKRELQRALARAPGIVDAVIQGEGVRVIAPEAAAPDLGALLPQMPQARAAPVAPRFEDSFVVMLHGERRSAAPAGGRPPDDAAPPAGIGEQVIEVRGLVRRFGEFTAVAGIDFEVRRGEIFGLLGANGAGKSTTFRMLCGLLPASAGTLRVAGVDLRRAAASARAKIGYMAQTFALYANLSVNQNLEFFSRVYGLRGERRAARVAWANAEFDLAPLGDRPSADLPLGYKQRLAMACALMHEPEILFLDEPTSGVDPLARREFWRRIYALARAGVTVLVTTHFMEEAEYCDRLAIMAAGRLLAVGTPAEIKARAQEGGAPQPSMEDAFIRLIGAAGEQRAAA